VLIAAAVGRTRSFPQDRGLANVSSFRKRSSYAWLGIAVCTYFHDLGA